MATERHLEGGAGQQLSVVVPCYDEAACLPRLVAEIDAVLARLFPDSEILVVDDGSSDDSPDVLRRLGATCPQLCVVRHRHHCGQSAAAATGMRLARRPVVVTLDGDGQNDPADIPALVAALTDADLACGVRRLRHDGWLRRVSSRIGNGFRNVVTGIPVNDAGCGMRAVRREALAELPVFDGMHRFLPTLLRLQGLRVAEVEIGHRPRTGGRSKYGVRNRLLRGVVDCLAMRWWRRRCLPLQRVESVDRGTGDAAGVVASGVAGGIGSGVGVGGATGFANGLAGEGGRALDAAGRAAPRRLAAP